MLTSTEQETHDRRSDLARLRELTKKERRFTNKVILYQQIAIGALSLTVAILVIMRFV